MICPSSNFSTFLFRSSYFWKKQKHPQTPCMGLACFCRRFAGSRIKISCVSEVVKHLRLASQKVCEEDAGVTPAGTGNRSCFSRGRVLPGLIHGSLVFHQDLAEGSCLASHDPPSPPPAPCSPPQPMAPWKTQHARSLASWPVSGQGQGRGIPAPPPGNTPPCMARTPAAAKNPPASHGDHPERETGGCTDPSLSHVCPSLGIFPFPQHHGQSQGGCGSRTPSCIPW